MFIKLKSYFLLIKNTIVEEGWAILFKKTRIYFNNIFRRQRSVLKIRDQTPKAVNLAKSSGEILPFVDIIIVTHNSQDCVSNCIASIRKSHYPDEKISILIVDNNSSDDTKRIIKESQSTIGNCALIESEINNGFGAANNLGFKSTTNKYILFLNPDTVLENNTLLCLVETALQTEHCGFCAWEARQQPYEHPKLYDPVTLETEWVSGACFLMLREAFEHINGFDENIFLYGEDVDLSWRLRGAGYRLQYVPSAVVNHFTYNNKSVIKPTQFLNSIISNGIIRFKFGRLTDVAFYYLKIMAELILPPIKKIRLKLIMSLFTMIPNLLKAMAWRSAHKKEIPGIAPRFYGWDYDVRRKGVFYINKLAKEKPIATIIIRTTQRPFFLREALQSVKNQTYRPIEIIVIEDGTAASERVIDEFADTNIQYIPTGNRVGRCRAGNLGLCMATGKYINFLDDDDLLFSDHIEVLIGELETDRLRRLAAYSTGFEVPTQVLSPNPFKYKEIDYRVVYDKPFDRRTLEKANYIPINCMLFNRELFVKEGGFDEALDLLEDWDLWLRYSSYTDFIYVEKTTCMYRVPATKRIAKEREKLMYKVYRDMGLKLQRMNRDTRDNLQICEMRV